MESSARLRHGVVGVSAVTVAVLAAMILAPPFAAAGALPLPANLVPVKIFTEVGVVPGYADPKGGVVLFTPRGQGSPGVPPSLIDIDLQGLDPPEIEFTSGEPLRLQFELYFDSYDEGKDVRRYTDLIMKLVSLPSGRHAPPTCTITWPTGPEFKCVLESFSLRFTLFLDDGTPVRAIMHCTFKEYTNNR